MREALKKDIHISTHDLTKRSTLEGIIETKPMVISTHDLTKRSTSGFRITAYSNIDFNSRPHEEVDWFSRAKEMHKDISTHDLTKRSTFLLCKNIFENNFNSRPHEEVDCVVLNLCVLWNISTHDLTKRSTNRRRCALYCICISTHDLTKRSTADA